jgi:hypothetical protein
MTTSAPALNITDVDFATLPRPDFEASMNFYGTVRGLPFVKRQARCAAPDQTPGHTDLRQSV